MISKEVVARTALVFVPLGLCAGLSWSPLEKAVLICVYQMFMSYCRCVYTGNYSHVDEIWTLSPILYATVLKREGTRGWLILLLISIWGVRLANYLNRRGLFHGVEDHRWKVVRERFTSSLQWHVFTITFMCLLCNLAELLMMLPVYYSPEGDLDSWDIVPTFLLVSFLLLEVVADEQQHSFQTKKYYFINNNMKPEPPYDTGFRTTGLFRYSRHPNFFGELGIWWSLCLFTRSVNISYIGAASLTYLLHRSTNLTEKLTASKYENYKEYQQTTSRIVPWLPKTRNN